MFVVFVFVGIDTVLYKKKNIKNKRKKIIIRKNKRGNQGTNGNKTKRKTSNKKNLRKKKEIMKKMQTMKMEIITIGISDLLFVLTIIPL